MSPDSFSSGSFPNITIYGGERLPDCCISCGMFTDYFVKSKFRLETQTSVKAGESGSEIALGCLLHLLGPIGMIVAAILGSGSGSDSTEKTVTRKLSIKVPCCRLCAGQQVPVAIEATGDGNQFVFNVHPRFSERLLELRNQHSENS